MYSVHAHKEQKPIAHKQHKNYEHKHIRHKDNTVWHENLTVIKFYGLSKLLN